MSIRVAVTSTLLLLTAALQGCGEQSANPHYKSDVNQSPVIEGLHDTTMTVGRLLVMPYRAYDPDGDSFDVNVGIGLTYEEWAEGYSPAVGLDFDESLLWYVPEAREGDARTIVVYATDPLGAEGEVAITVTLVHAALADTISPATESVYMPKK